MPRLQKTVAGDAGGEGSLGVKKNPGELTVEERLTEALRERDECSGTCMKLVQALESLVERHKEILVAAKRAKNVDEAEQQMQHEREVIRKARRGR
jgi:hypothetical protein